MKLAVDSSALILLINPAANPPDDPDTKKPVAHARERIELFLSSLSVQDTLIVPTPVLAEVLVGAEEGGPGLLAAISGMARLKVRPFGERAAIETAMMTHEAIAAGDKRAGSQAPWQKVKVDRQVLAVARAEGATRVYTDDANLVEFARKLGMDVFSTWDLPMPEVAENLFTVAGVPEQQPQSDSTSARLPNAPANDVADDHEVIDEILRDLEAGDLDGSQELTPDAASLANLGGVGRSDPAPDLPKGRQSTTPKQDQLEQ